MGYQDGSEKAFQEHKGDFAMKLSLLDQLFASIEVLKNDLVKEHDTQFVELSFHIAKKIALRDLSEHHDAIVTLLHDVVSELQSEQKVTVNVAPNEVETIHGMQKRADVKMEALNRLQIVADPAIQAGGCMIDLQYGQMNMTVPDRVERIWEALDKQISINKKS